MKIQYGIAGFVIGILGGLLIGLAEMKLMMHFQWNTAIPFAIGFTVLIAAITGIRVALKIYRRQQ
jgi:ABC-type antimicrobial peptide transport system permease subunit